MSDTCAEPCASPTRDAAASVVLTGATGFVGHYLLAELLRRGCRCTVVLRRPVEESRGRLAGLLREVGVDADPHAAAGSLHVVEGDLLDRLPTITVGESAVLVHAAGVTNFRLNAAGEPHKTNVLGTRRLVSWAWQMGIRHLHLVSSAYACGKASGPACEKFACEPAPFHNDYERTKWESERICLEWARASDRTLTIYRPSIVVGAFESGRATRFSGVYICARATEILDRMHRNCRPHERQAIPLRICGRPLDCQNIVPVDYVAAMMATVICDAQNPQYNGRIYNLVHPDPPTNLQIKQALEQCFDIGGGRFVAPEAFDRAELNEHERCFYDVSRPIQHYFVDSPRFVRDNTAEVEQHAGLECPTYDAGAIARLVRYAQSVGWGRQGAGSPPQAGRTSGRSHGGGCAEYFESFLPAHISRSQVARMTALTATVRFVIEDEPNGQWVCYFDAGRLAKVERGENGCREDFGYRTSREVFWESITGQYHPQEFFLTGRAHMFGDVERALKMAMVLHAFTVEFPSSKDSLAHIGEQQCSRS